ncbi:MAG: phosphotransferase family protein [Acidobacteria bacterium]|nr:phosphotransferase family protein [Acidobacteriota bacterium]
MKETAEIRPGEQLNQANLQAFLRSALGLKTEEIRIEQFPAGSSNLTYLVKISDKEFVLRHPPFGNQVKSAHDMKREFDVLSKLSTVYQPAPKPFFYCADETVTGAEFYLMERRRGLIVRGKAPQSLENSKDLQRKVCEKFVENLAALHAIDYKRIGLQDLGKPDGYVKRQVEGWTKRYFNAKTDENFELETAIEWLAQNTPNSSGAALIHNDYKFDNLMHNPENLTQIVAVLDWEMATLGEPMMDLGTTLGYWISKDAGAQLLNMPFNPRVLMENFSRKELVEMYAEKSGADVSGILFYYVFGTFKIAAIAQQIYFRFASGTTHDKRFAQFNLFVGALGKIALRAIEKGKI